MRLLDVTLDSPEENLALDEALLAEADAAVEPLETLRFWEVREAVVVVGRNSRLAEEVNLEACRRRGVSGVAARQRWRGDCGGPRFA